MPSSTAALLHAPDLQSFWKPREQASASILTRVHAETRTHADIAITTAEGDVVMLSASAVLQTAYTSYDARGRLVGQGLEVHADAAQAVTSQDAAIAVTGDLSDAELADVHHLLENLGAIVAEFLAGDLDEAMTHALDLGALDTLANFDASFAYVQHVHVEQQYTAQETLYNTPTSMEQPVASTQINPDSIEQTGGTTPLIYQWGPADSCPQGCANIDSVKHLRY